MTRPVERSTQRRPIHGTSERILGATPENDRPKPYQFTRRKSQMRRQRRRKTVLSVFTFLFFVSSPVIGIWGGYRILEKIAPENAALLLDLLPEPLRPSHQADLPNHKQSSDTQVTTLSELDYGAEKSVLLNQNEAVPDFAAPDSSDRLDETDNVAKVDRAVETRAPDLADVIETAEISVVRIHVVGVGRGSGVIVSDTGLIVTNYHVLEGGRRVDVEFKDGSRVAIKRCVALDKGRDLAVLKVDAPKSLVHPLALAKNLPRKGEKVIAIGAPLDLAYTATEGIVSAVRTGRELQMPQGSTWIQTSAPISSGNSGGPLLNMQGEIVGLNTWRFLKGQNLNFAISAQDIATLLKRPHSGFVPLPRANRSKPIANRSRPKPNPSKPIDRKRSPNPIPPRLVMPSERVLELESMFLDLTAYEFVPSGSSVAEFHYASGKLWATVPQMRGKLHGINVAYYETGDSASMASYWDGDRHGNFMTKNQQGQKHLFAQYFKGRRHGFTCYFQNDELALVQEYVHDNLKGSHLIKNGKIATSYDANIPKDEFVTFHKEIESVFSDIKKNEIKFKKLVKKWDKDQRQVLAAAKSRQARHNIRARSAQRNAEFNATIDDLRRRSEWSPF